MRNVIHQLRKKPGHAKEQIAVVGALGIALVVGLFWVSSLPGQLRSGSVASSDNRPSPFALLRQNLSAAVGNSGDFFHPSSFGANNTTETNISVTQSSDGAVNFK